MALKSLEDLFLEDLKDLYNAESQILKALPKMIKASSSQRLRQALEEHMQQTEGQVTRLEQVFDMLDKRPRGKKCKGMEGIIEEGKEALTVDAEPEVLDAAIIGAAQKVEHYEMATYGTVRTYARQMGYDEAAELLQQTLDEEGEANKILTSIAEGGVNQRAEIAPQMGRGRGDGQSSRMESVQEHERMGGKGM